MIRRKSYESFIIQKGPDQKTLFNSSRIHQRFILQGVFKIWVQKNKQALLRHKSFDYGYS